MNHTTRMTKPLNHLSRAAATAAAALLLAAPLAASAQSNDGVAPTPDQVSQIQQLTKRYFEDVHYARINDLSQFIAPDFAVTYPNGSTIDMQHLMARADSRLLEERNYEHSTKLDSIVMDGPAIVEHVSAEDSALVMRGGANPQQNEDSKRTLIWVKNMDGNWMLASERINEESGTDYGGETLGGSDSPT